MNHQVISFNVSLFCNYGILGGWLIADSEKLIYKTGKLIIPPEYKNLEMYYKNILSITKGWFLIFPTVSLSMNNGDKYKFIVFSRNRFISLVNDKRVN